MDEKDKLGYKESAGDDSAVEVKALNYELNHPAASSGVSQSSFPRRRESIHEELDTRFRGYDKRSKLRGI